MVTRSDWKWRRITVSYSSLMFLAHAPEYGMRDGRRSKVRTPMLPERWEW